MQSRNIKWFKTMFNFEINDFSLNDLFRKLSCLYAFIYLLAYLV